MDKKNPRILHDIDSFIESLLIEVWFDKNKTNFDIVWSQLKASLIDDIVTATLVQFETIEQDELERHIRNNNFDVLDRYLSEKFPWYDDMLWDVVEKFRKDYIASMKV